MEARNLEVASCISGLRLLVVHLFFTSTFAVHACNQEKIFSDIIQGKALVNHTYKTLQSVIDDDGCQFYCFLDDVCISYNFDEQQRICNLSDSDHIIHPEDLVYTPNAVYRALKVEIIKSLFGYTNCGM
ncbi:uncharacterized protein LOC110240459 isoform X2 [Exaiptasia diaphana]|uniref:Apple domain-containing protein n=1 Tax=Exaiptasia diaphana TaxID=2652724 RepID=A0A913YIS4_EXADI|nr:uncharacterized protein LOC110240459 isoform X2 [Exaiptasia diaphana]